MEKRFHPASGHAARDARFLSHWTLKCQSQGPVPVDRPRPPPPAFFDGIGTPAKLLYGITHSREPTTSPPSQNCPNPVPMSLESVRAFFAAKAPEITVIESTQSSA